jgi:hypothetical protein
MSLRRLLCCGTAALAACAQPNDSLETPPWSIDPTPVLDVHDTAVGGASILESARFATRLPSGAVVVADQYADVLRFFDAEGRPLRNVGRKGQGPGEFGDVVWVSHCGADSLYAWTYTRRMMLVFDAAGEFTREFRPQGNAHEFTCSSTGQFVALGLPDRFVQPNAEGETATASIWLADTQGDSIASLGSHPFGENRALGRFTRIAFGSDVIYIGTADSAWVDTHYMDGRPKKSLPLGVEPRAPTQVEYARAIEKLIAVTPNRAVRDAFRARYAALPIPARLPPYVDLRVDPTGLLWAVIPGASDGETRLRAIDADGIVQGDVTVPIQLTVFEIGRDYILGGYRDSSELEHVVLFRLNRS